MITNRTHKLMARAFGRGPTFNTDRWQHTWDQAEKTYERLHMNPLEQKQRTHEQRQWLRPYSLVGVGTDGCIVQCMSYPTPEGNVYVRMIPGETCSARLVPVKGLKRIDVERYDAYVDGMTACIRNVAKLIA